MNVDWRTRPGFSERSDSLPLDLVDDILERSAFLEGPDAPHWLRLLEADSLRGIPLALLGAVICLPCAC